LNFHPFFDKKIKILKISAGSNFVYMKRYLFTFFSLFIILLLSYSNSFDCSWHFDDYINITENPNIQIKQFTPDNVEKIFLSIMGTGKISRPVSYLSFALNYYFDGLNVFGYHLVNFLIHFLSSVFVFLFIFNTLKLPLLKETYEKYAYSVALLSTIFWAVNPVQVTAVTYIVQRMASMAGLFFIMSMYFYLKFRTSPSSFLKYVHLFLCFASAALSIGSKENAAMLPASIYLYDLFFIQGLTADNVKKNIKIAIIPILILIAVVMIYFDFSYVIGGYEIRPFTMQERLLTQPRVILFYISLLFYPLTSRLTLIHDIQISKSLIDPWTTLAAIVTILLMVSVSLIKARKWPLFSYCVLFFFLNHLIEGSFLSLELIFEHRNYIPSMLLFIPLSVGLVKALEYFSQRKLILYILAMSITLVIIVLSVSVTIQNNIMHDEISLWSDNVKKSPRLHHPHQCLAVALLISDRLPEAFEELNEALKSYESGNINKKSVTYGALGEYYFIRGDDDQALKYFNKSIIGYPLGAKQALSFDRMANIMMRRGNLVDAEKMALKAIELKPHEAGFYQTYSAVLNKKNQPDEAIKQAQIALKLDPESHWPYIFLAEAYRIKNNKKAEEHFLNICNMLKAKELQSKKK
jgi:tetratricopeptide (TPR) repeat protein